MTRPVNFGLVDAVSRIGGYARAELPGLLEGIQPVAIYADVSQSVASEVFEARAITSIVLPAYAGLEIFSIAPGGIVIEEIDARMDATGGLPALGVNIATAQAGGATLTKLDVGGVATASVVRQLGAALPFGAVLVWKVDFITGGGASIYSLSNRTRMWVPSGQYFQLFPIGLGAAPSNVSIHVGWRELADVQGAP